MCLYEKMIEKAEVVREEEGETDRQTDRQIQVRTRAEIGEMQQQARENQMPPARHQKLR